MKKILLSSGEPIPADFMVEKTISQTNNTTVKKDNYHKDNEMPHHASETEDTGIGLFSVTMRNGERYFQVGVAKGKVKNMTEQEYNEYISDEKHIRKSRNI